MNRLLIPLILLVCTMILLSIQCTLAQRWQIWNVHLELLPAILLYTAFSVNLSTALILGASAAIMYDSYSGGHLGASLLPYILVTSIFCFIRPVFFRNRMTTQFFCGVVFAFFTLLFQWTLSGKFSIGIHTVLSKISLLALVSGVLSILYFLMFDFLSRLMGLTPGRFEEYDQ